MPKRTTIYSRSGSLISHNWDRILFLILLSVFFLLSPGQNIYTMNMYGSELPVPSLPVTIPSPAPLPVNVTGVFPGSDVTASGVVVLDVDSHIFLYKRNEEARFSPASTTKIITALVSLDAYELDDVVTIGNSVHEGATMGLIAGEQITVENLLYGALIQSGNDAAYALAEHYPGGVEKFVAAMNQKAKDIHLTNSSFTNPVGYDDPNHYMAPMDLARLAAVALQNKTLVKMVAIPQITISDVTHSYFHSLKNVNELLGKIPGVGGIKTGWTEQAGENLVTLVDRHGHRVVMVVLHSQDRFGDTQRLIDWVYGSHTWKVYAPE